MAEQGKHITRTEEMNAKVVRVLQRRVQLAQERFLKRAGKAVKDHLGSVRAKRLFPWEVWTDGCDYALDWTQRSILFWDTLRQRGNLFLEHERAGQPPVLHFKYEMVLDARKFERPVNYALVRILPPKGVSVGPERRPYIILDPRA